MRVFGAVGRTGGRVNDLAVPSRPLDLLGFWGMVGGFPCNPLKVKLLASENSPD